MSTTTSTTVAPTTTTTTTAAPTVDIRSILVRIKRSAVPNKIPTVDDLELGELAINYHDGRLYALKFDGVNRSIVHLSDGKTYTAGSGIRIDGTIIENTGVTRVSGIDNITVSENTGDVVISFDGVLGIEKGGTGQTTATAAFNALAPNQTGNDGKFLVTDGENVEWSTIDAEFLIETLGYTPVNRAGDTMEGNLSFGGTHRITDLPEPQASNEPATKNYVDNLLSGLNWKPAVVAKAVTNVNLNTGPWVIDGYTVNLNDRILLTNQTIAAQNGIWVRTDGLTPFSRPLDSDTVEKLQSAAVFVQHGTVYEDTGWVQVSNLTSFSGQAWEQFTGGGSLSAGQGIAIDGNVINNTGVRSIVGSNGIGVSGSRGDIQVSLNGPVPIDLGGTGAQTAAAAITALLPTQTGNSGAVLTTNGTTVSWLNFAGIDPTANGVNVYHVAKNGNDLTGDGTPLRPFRTVARALDFTNAATINDPKVIRIASGRYVETQDIELRPWVFLVGDHHQDCRVTAPTFKLHSSWAGTDDIRSGAINLTINGPSNFDFELIGSTTGKLFFESVNFNSTYYCNSNSTVNQIFVENGWMFGTVLIYGGTHNFNGTYFFAQARFEQAPGNIDPITETLIHRSADGSVTLLNCAMQNVFFTVLDAYYGGWMTLNLFNSPILPPYKLVISSAALNPNTFPDGYGAIYCTSNSLPARENLENVNNMRIYPINDAYGILYTPTASIDWTAIGATPNNRFTVTNALDYALKYQAGTSTHWTLVGETLPETNKTALDKLASENYKRWLTLRTVKTITSNLTLPGTDRSTSVILADASAASISIVLPDAAEYAQKVYTIKKIDATPNLVTISTPLGSGQEIENDSSYILSGENEVITLISDGSDWFDISRSSSAGYTGSRGVPGYTGSQGVQGPIGFTGSVGPAGPIGPEGGPPGPQGPEGPIGPRGYTGSQGIQGPPGGPPGEIGYTGYTGSQGYTGSKGDTGPEGPQGPAGGYTGSQGERGFTGSQGEPGLAGGYTGSQGERGPMGYTGSAGQNGTDGISAGTTFKYKYRVLTASAASPSEVNFDNLNLQFATLIRIHYLDTLFTLNKDFLLTVANSDSAVRGHLVFTKESDASVFVVYEIIGNVINDTTNQNVRIPLRYVSGSSSLVYSDSDFALISFVRSGDRGSLGYTGSQGPIGPIGYTGSIGAPGIAGGLNFLYTYNNHTTSDAVPGIVRFNANPLSTATGMRLHDVDAFSNNNFAVFTAIQNIDNPTKGFVNIIDRNDASKSTIFKITGLNYLPSASYYEFTVEFISGRTTIPNDSPVNVSLIVNGDQGYTGSRGFTGSRGAAGDSGINYTFRGTVAEAPNSGEVAANPNLAAVSTLLVHHNDINGTNFRTFLLSIDDSTSSPRGYIILSNRFNSANRTIFNITGTMTEDGRGFFYIPVAYSSGSTAVVGGTGTEISLAFFRNGDAGTVGFTGSQGLQGPRGYTGSAAVLEVTEDGASSALYPVMALGTGTQSPRIDTTDLSFNATLGRLFTRDLKLSGVLDIQEALEAVTVFSGGGGISGLVQFDAMTQSILFYAENAGANWTLNVRGNSSTALNTFMQTGQSLTLTLLAAQGATGYSQTAMTIAGTSVTVRWLNSTPPSAGIAQTITAYTFSIIKTAANTYTVLGNTASFG